VKFLGKVLFPHLAPWQQKRQTRAILWSVLTACVFTAVVVAIMFFVNSRR
jgi:predicted tellurium resistance membrane protein TerC